MKDVLGKVLRKIKPKVSDEVKLKEFARKTLEISHQIAKKYNAKAMLAGSVTRGTWLPRKREFDVFILFPESLPEDKLEEYGLVIGKTVIKQLKGKFSVEYAQHPYASGKVEDVDIDIVPCYEVESAEKIKSAVDRTPFHVRYIEKNLPMNLSDDVRLLKQLLSANNMYGADSKTQGFSGYVCELLIIHYGGFLKTVNAVARWMPGEVIDSEKHYKKEEHNHVRKSFKGNSLILIDPTDRNRNTASALSAENFLKFKKLAWMFIAKPMEQYFFVKKEKSLTNSGLEKALSLRKTELILIRFKPPKVVPDILWPQLRRFTERMANILEETRYEFKVLRSGCYSDEKDVAIVLLEMETFQLPPVQKRVGPSVFDFKDAKRFLEKYKHPMTGPFVEGNYWAVEIKRKFTSAHEKVLDSLKNSPETLKAKGVPNYIADQLPKGFEVIHESRKIGKLLRKNREFGIFLKNYFDKEGLAV